MLESTIRILLILLFASIPFTLWGYGNTFLSKHAWNRFRFFAWMLIGIISIGCIFFFEKFLEGGFSERIIWVAIIFLLLGWISLLAILSGSLYIRWFLKKSLFLHFFLFLLVLFILFLTSRLLPLNPWDATLLWALFGIFLAASLEEWVKHIGSVGLVSKDFRFSKSDFVLFSFFIALGFSAVENLIYLVIAHDNSIRSIFFTGTWRTLFSLPLHIFASGICIVFWWKALSYKPFSLRYSIVFLMGFLLSISIHALYNYSTKESTLFFILPLLSLLSYIFFIQWIREETAL